VEARGRIERHGTAARPPLTPAQVRQLPRLDIAFFAAALLTLTLKMLLYVTIAVISIVPTRRFIGWRRALDAGGPPPDAAAVSGVRRLLHLELGLMAMMPLAAVLMARGIGR
jgi:uncharacterized membrane protein